jgi:hypothetical protein
MDSIYLIISSFDDYMDDETFCLQIICLLYGQKLISISLYLHMIYDLIYKFEKKKLLVTMDLELKFFLFILLL